MLYNALVYIYFISSFKIHFEHCIHLEVDSLRFIVTQFIIIYCFQIYTYYKY